MVQAHWEQLEEMEALWHKEGTLLCQQPDMVRINQSHICLLPFYKLHFTLITHLCLSSLSVSLPQQAFGEYVHKLEDIMERKARCVHSMIAQLQPYLKLSQSNQPHNKEEDNHDPNT